MGNYPRHKYRKWDIERRKPNHQTKEQLRKEIEIATKEYLKNNEITHLPNSPNKKVTSVRIKDLREISDTEEFYYLEEQNEDI